MPKIDLKICIVLLLLLHYLDGNMKFANVFLLLTILTSNCLAYKKLARYNFDHGGFMIGSVFPQECRGWCYPGNPDLYQVNIWIPNGETCPETIDHEVMHKSLTEFNPRDQGICAKVLKYTYVYQSN